jgi:hypothetical protein
MNHLGDSFHIKGKEKKVRNGRLKDGTPWSCFPGRKVPEGILMGDSFVLVFDQDKGANPHGDVEQQADLLGVALRLAPELAAEISGNSRAWRIAVNGKDCGRLSAKFFHIHIIVLGDGDYLPRIVSVPNPHI